MKSKLTPARYMRWAVVLALMAFLVPVCLLAQEARGRITGRVVDSTKAAIPGASVEVKDAARGTTAALTTNAEGLFQATYLLPGTYEVSVQIAGFKRYVKKDVLVQVNETRDLTITLDVGGIEETVSVTADAATLN